MGGGPLKSTETQPDRHNGTPRSGIQSPMNQVIFRIPESDYQSLRTGVSGNRGNEVERRSKDAHVESTRKDLAASSLIKGGESISGESEYNLQPLANSNKKASPNGFLNSQLVVTSTFDDQTKSNHVRQLSKSDTSIKKIKDETKLESFSPALDVNSNKMDTGKSTGMREFKGQSFEELARAAD